MTVTPLVLLSLEKGIYGGKWAIWILDWSKCLPPCKGGDGDFLQPPFIRNYPDTKNSPEEIHHKKINNKLFSNEF